MISVSQHIVNFKLNKPQAAALLIMAHEMWLLWSRGTGKTVGAIAPWILHKVEVMPRSSGGLIGTSFADLESKILQPIFLAFEMLGYIKDEGYVYGKRPPDHWVKPLTPIIDYEHVVSFPNGTTMELISLHKKGSANGKSFQWIVGDEAKLLNENQLRQEVFPILRGHVRHFGDSPWYGAKLFVTDKYSPSLHWILEKRKLHDKALTDAILHYQIKYNNLQVRFADCTNENTKAKIKQKMGKLSDLLTALRKQSVYFSEASAYDNLENLSKDYIENMRRSMTGYEFSIAIENEDPTRAENGYYAARTEQHLYDHPFDDDVTKPLGVTFDYQASISPLAVFQVNDLVIPGGKSLNYLNNFYVLQPLGLKEVVDQFCDYYADRPCKQVFYFYDHTAKGRRNGHKSYKDEIVQFFTERGWTVVEIYMGQAPGHGIKYNRLKTFFEENEEGKLPIRIHRHRCATMVLAMDQTRTKETSAGTEKNKGTETKEGFPQEQSTHFPDAFDMGVWAVLEMDLYPYYVDATAPAVIR